MQPKLRMLVLCLLLPSSAMAQNGTIWTGRTGEWFDRSQWSAGVPSAKISAVIPSGQVTAAVGRLAPTTADLTVGQSNRRSAGNAQLTVGGSLGVNGGLYVGQSVGQDAAGSLIVERGTARSTGDILLGPEVILGEVVEGSGLAEAKVQVAGSLLSLNRINPSLFVGRNRASGTAAASAFVGGSIGTRATGFNRVHVGYAEEGTKGRSSGLLQVPAIFGGGKGSVLSVGVNQGGGHSDGQLVVRAGGISGFDTVLIGAATGGGTASGQVVLDGILQADQLQLGSESGRATGQLVLSGGARFEGKLLTVHPRSELVSGSELTGNVTNGGTISINGVPSASRSSTTTINGRFVQTRMGVTSFDIHGPSLGTGYEALVVGSSADLGGRFDLNFADGFVPKEGQVFDLVQSPATKLNGLILNPVNVPADLALVSNVGRSGLQVSVVQPEPRAFLNPDRNVLRWSDAENWSGGQVPTSINQLNLVNEKSSPQSVIVGTDVAVQSLQIGGTIEPITLDLQENVSFSATHQIQLDRDGVVVLNNGSLLTPVVKTLPGSQLIGQGLVAGDVSNSGRLKLGATEQPATLEVRGDFAQSPGGIFEIDVLGGRAGQFDQLQITGAAKVDGLLHIRLPDDFEITAGLQIPIITAQDGLFGDFKFRVEGVNLEGFEFSFSGGEGQTQYVMFMEEVGPDDVGDMNRDGFVDECDFDAFSLALRDVDAYFDEFDWSPAARGNINDDGEFDVDDIQPFFDMIDGVACQAQAAAIPEPDTGSLSWGVLACIFIFRKHRVTRTSRTKTTLRNSRRQMRHLVGGGKSCDH